MRGVCLSVELVYERRVPVTVRSVTECRAGV